METHDAGVPPPPHNYEAEQAFLGAVFVENRVLDTVSDFLLPDHFADPVHAKIYALALSETQSGRRFTAVRAKGLLKGDAALQELGGDTYLAALTRAAVTVHGATDYARLIFDLHQRRELMLIADDLARAAASTDGSQTADAVQGQAEERLFALSSGAMIGGGPRHVADALTDALTMADAVYKSDGQAIGVRTGLAPLDAMMGGMRPSDLIVLGGRPSMGKTALGVDIAVNAAMAGHVVAFFSLEMSAEQLGGRMLARFSGVSASKQSSGPLTQDDMDALCAAQGRLHTLPMHIDDGSALSAQQIRTRARRLRRQHGRLDLIVVDYLQLMTPPESSKRDNSVAKVTAISGALKAMAKELNVPVIALSQLSRSLESREDKRPQLSDLRESGAIEQDANVVLFTFRNEYYLERSEPGRRPDESDEKYNLRFSSWLTQMDACKGRAEVIVAKNRRGTVGNVTLGFDGPRTTFFDTNVPPDDGGF